MTSLAFTNTQTSSDVAVGLYGIDSNTQTLVRFVPSGSMFGVASAVGGQLGNLVDPRGGAVDYSGLDFDIDNRLITVENNSDVLLQVNTETGKYMSRVKS